MRYYLTNFHIQSYPFVQGRFEEELNSHLLDQYDRDKEVAQVWKSHTSRSGDRDFDYFNVLWRSTHP